MSNETTRRIGIDYTVTGADQLKGVSAEVAANLKAAGLTAKELADALKAMGASQASINAILKDYTNTQQQATASTSAAVQVQQNFQKALAQTGTSASQASQMVQQFQRLVNQTGPFQAPAPVAMATQFSQLVNQGGQSVLPSTAGINLYAQIAQQAQAAVAPTAQVQQNVAAMTGATQQATPSAAAYAFALNQIASGGKNAAQGANTALMESRGLRDALFALGLTINLISTELGSQLSPAAKQVSSDVRIMADAMLAGAYIGNSMAAQARAAGQSLSILGLSGGAAGAAIGLVGGVLLSLGAMALTLDPTIKALNDNLDKLGKKDDATQGLAKLAGVTDETAQAAMDYVKANQSVASSFDDLVHQAQPAVPVLQGIGDAVRGLTTANHDLFQSLQDSIPLYKAWADTLGNLGPRLQNVGVYNQAYSNALREGKGVIQAQIIASQALTDAQDNQGKVVDRLTAVTQAYANAQNELNTIVLRDTISKDQEAIDKLRLQGAATDELDRAILKLLQDQRTLNGETPSYFGARIQAPSPIGLGDVQTEAARQQKNLSIFNDIAQKLYSDLLDAQQNYNDSSATLSEDHNARLQEIANSGAEQVLRINREFAQRLLDIQQNLIDSEASALDDLNSSIADAEENAQDRRNTINQDYADKRVQIEKDYQDKIAQIWSTYAASLLDIEARRDDLGLLRARQTRDKQLKDAADQKQKDDENADKQRAKDLKALDDALAKQEAKLKEAYEKRIKALEDQAAKERAKAEQNHTDQLNDQATAQQKQVDSENLSYRNRQEQLDRALANRKDALIKSLVADKAITEEYGKAIIESLRGILDPDVIASLLNDLQQQLSAKVTVSITTIGTFVPPTGPPGTKFELGGRVPFTMPALVHAEETILPKIADAGSMNRAYNLAMAHLSGGRVAPPQTIFSSSAGSFSGVIDLNVYPVVNDGVFNARVEAVSMNTMIRVNQRSR